MNASNSYLQTLQSVDVRLKRQIYGLEEADIIPADKASSKIKGDSQDSQASAASGKTGPGGASAHVNGGIGKLDIGWLNSRSGRVGRDMEAELWAEAKGFLEKVLAEQTDGQKSHPPDEDVVMGT